MPSTPSREPCPFCGELISVKAVKCRFCGEELYETEELPERPRRAARQSSSADGTEFLIPTNVSAWSMAACYLGLIGFCLPLIGLVFAIPAFIFGIIALLKRRKTGTYGAVTSDIRAIIGLVLSGLAILGWGGILIVLIVTKSF